MNKRIESIARIGASSAVFELRKAIAELKFLKIEYAGSLQFELDTQSMINHLESLETYCTRSYDDLGDASKMYVEADNDLGLRMKSVNEVASGDIKRYTLNVVGTKV